MAPYDTVDARQARAASPSAVSLPSTAPPKSRWWVWLVVVGLIAAGVWYLRGRAPQAASSATPGGVPGH